MGKWCLRDSTAFFLFFRASGVCPHFFVPSGISGNFLLFFFTRLSKVRYNVLAKDENFMFSYFFSLWFYSTIRWPGEFGDYSLCYCREYFPCLFFDILLSMALLCVYGNNVYYIVHTLSHRKCECNDHIRRAFFFAL